MKSNILSYFVNQFDYLNLLSGFTLSLIGLYVEQIHLHTIYSFIPTPYRYNKRQSKIDVKKTQRID